MEWIHYLNQVEKFGCLRDGIRDRVTGVTKQHYFCRRSVKHVEKCLHSKSGVTLQTKRGEKRRNGMFYALEPAKRRRHCSRTDITSANMGEVALHENCEARTTEAADTPGTADSPGAREGYIYSA
jgi:hypothetical protein